MADEFITIGSSGNRKKYVESASSSGTVAEYVATWAQPSTEIVGYFKIDQTTPGVSNAVVITSTSGGIVAPTTGMQMPVVPYQYNGVGYERVYGNHVATLLGSTSRTATTASADQTNYNARGLILQVVCDTSTGASITPTLQIKDSISSGYMTIWTAAAALASTGHYAYLFDMGGVGGAGSYTEAVNLRLARTWRLNVTHSSSGVTQYSASADNLV